VSRSDLDAALSAAGLEVPIRYTSQVENHRQCAPSRAFCEIMALRLSLDPSVVWLAALRDRLLKSGLIDVYEQLITGDAGREELETLRAENRRLRAKLSTLRSVLDAP
jgi:hypothetical protein